MKRVMKSTIQSTKYYNKLNRPCKLIEGIFLQNLPALKNNNNTNTFKKQLN